MLKPFSMIKSWPVLNPVRHYEQNLLVDRRTLLRSDLFNVLWRPCEVNEFLQLCVREAGRICGILYVYRAAGEPPFERNDFELLESMAGFVAHGMTRARFGGRRVCRKRRPIAVYCRP